MTLAVNDSAPDFSLQTDQDETIHLHDFLGKKVLLYFYPKDNTPVCTQQACQLRDHFAELKKAGVIILGVSKDSAKTHANFKSKHQLPFTLLVDASGDVCTNYGVIDKKSLFGNTFLGITRSSFLINEDGKIMAIWRKVKVANQIDDILAALAAGNAHV